MGQAKRRGSFEERKAAAMSKRELQGSQAALNGEIRVRPGMRRNKMPTALLLAMAALSENNVTSRPIK